MKNIVSILCIASVFFGFSLQGMFTGRPRPKLKPVIVNPAQVPKITPADLAPDIKQLIGRYVGLFGDYLSKDDKQKLNAVLKQ